MLFYNWLFNSWENVCSTNKNKKVITPRKERKQNKVILLDQMFKIMTVYIRQYKLRTNSQGFTQIIFSIIFLQIMSTCCTLPYLFWTIWSFGGSGERKDHSINCHSLNYRIGIVSFRKHISTENIIYLSLLWLKWDIFRELQLSSKGKVIWSWML